MTDELLLERRGALGCVTLNRPRALNALTLEMIRALDAQLTAWEREPEVKAVVIRSAGGKAFCAGGDVRAVAESLREPPPPGAEPFVRAFFREEYRLNFHIHYFAKPFISLVDGICMGGGLGVSLHGSHRVVTGRVTLAMPETAIGLLPDIGGGWFLPGFPGQIGTYLALTGARFGAADAAYVGYATHAVGDTPLDQVFDALLTADWSSRPAREVASQALEPFVEPPGEPALAALREAIDRCFGLDTAEEILRALEAEGTSWADETRATLLRMCPFSVKLTLRQLRLGATRTYDEMVTLEYRASQRLAARPDFREGIRAVLVDKDHRARWQPPTLAEVRTEEVEGCFAPLGEDDLVLTPPAGAARG